MPGTFGHFRITPPILTHISCVLVTMKVVSDCGKLVVVLSERPMLLTESRSTCRQAPAPSWSFCRAASCAGISNMRLLHNSTVAAVQNLWAVVATVPCC